MMAERGTRRSLGFRNSQGRSNPAVLLVSILLGLSIVLGGGGTPNPLSETLLMLAATGVALAWLAFRLRGPVDPRIVLLILLALALPLAQLIPLPPTIWHNLPGRELEVAALRLTGDDQTWRAFSIAYRERSDCQTLRPPNRLSILSTCSTTSEFLSRAALCCKILLCGTFA